METSTVEHNVTALLQDADILRGKGSSEEALQKMRESSKKSWSSIERQN